jgi:RIP metalloprotease RseP
VSDTLPRPSVESDRDPPGQPTESSTSDRWLGLALLAGLVALLGFFAGVPALAMVLAIVVSIFLHELGHYLVARWAGMKVTEFFIGFGPKLWSFQRGETEYGVKLIFAGAYVRIIGMSNLEEVDAPDEARTYRAQPYRKRLPVVLAGPFANFLIAFVLLFVVFAGFGRATQDEWVVDSIVPGSAAEAAGVQPGDQIIEVNGTPIDGWDSMIGAMQLGAGQPAEIVVERAGERETLTASIGWRLSETGAAAVVAVANDGTDTRPLRRGDRILAVGNQEVDSYQAFAAAMADRPAGETTVRFAREIRTAEGSGTWEYIAHGVRVPADLPADGAVGFFGIGPTEAEASPLPAGEAVVESGKSFGALVTASVEGIWNFFSPAGLGRYADLVVSTPPTGSEGETVTARATIEPVDDAAPPPAVAATEINPNRPSSILGIVRLGSQAAEGGVVMFLGLLIIVNVFLGLFNLLPLPPLDGGHAVVATYESIRERISGHRYRVNMNKLMPLTYVVVFVLVGLFVTSTYLDIVDPVPNPFGP